MSAPSGENFHVHGHRHKGRIIKASAKHANALQYFQPYAAGSGASGTDTDGEGVQ
jgi:F0F1-type ATP synthase alpha subunit